jgi:hypothetical protein
MHSPKFRSLYRSVLLSGNGAWRICLFNLDDASLRNSTDVVLILLWPCVPYLLLTWLVGVIRTPWVLYVVTVIVIGTDVLTGMALLNPTRSTSGLAALFMPLWQILFILPGGVALDLFVRWGYNGFRLRRKREYSPDDTFDGGEEEHDD